MNRIIDRVFTLTWCGLFGDLGSTTDAGLLATALEAPGLKAVAGMPEVANVGAASVAAAVAVFSLDAAIDGKTILSFATALLVLVVVVAGTVDVDEGGACLGLFGI